MRCSAAIRSSGKILMIMLNIYSLLFKEAYICSKLKLTSLFLSDISLLIRFANTLVILPIFHLTLPVKEKKYHVYRHAVLFLNGNDLRYSLSYLLQYQTSLHLEHRFLDGSWHTRHLFVSKRSNFSKSYMSLKICAASLM